MPIPCAINHDSTDFFRLMVTLTTDPLMIVLIQVATALPIFIFALPAGALADIIDRRRYLLTVQCLMFITAAALAIVTWMGGTTPWVLVAFTFALGCGAAFSAPAWQAVTPELVPRSLSENEKSRQLRPALPYLVHPCTRTLASMLN